MADIYQRERADYRRNVVNRFKRKKGCTDCGYKQHHAALEFDHRENDGRPYSGKQRTVASLMYSSMCVIKEEISKCDIVCANCHAIRTHKRRFNAVMVESADTMVLETIG